MKLHLGDQVVITTGKDKGKQGKIIRVLPKRLQVVVEGCNMRVKHRKPYGGTSGQRTVKEAPLAVGKVALLNSQGTPDRIGYLIQKDGEKIRTLRKSGQALAQVGGTQKSIALSATSKTKDAAKKSDAKAVTKTTAKKATANSKTKKK